MRIITQTLVLFIFCNAFAQLPADLINPTQPTTMFDQYAGTVYAQKEYETSDIIDEKSGTYKARLRYNSYSDAIEYKENGKLYELAKTTTTHFKIGNEYYYYCKFKNSRGFDKSGYYVLVELNDSYSIYKKKNLDITEPKEKDVVTGHTTIGKLKVEDIYFMEKKGKLTELPQNKKDILTVFSDEQDELKQYIKDEKIKVKNTHDLIRLVAKYNSLKGDIVNPSRSLLSNRDRKN